MGESEETLVDEPEGTTTRAPVLPEWVTRLAVKAQTTGVSGGTELSTVRTAVTGINGIAGNACLAAPAT